MKYLLIIAISLLLAQPALAAKKVGGSVPTTTPLQPMPAGASVNVKNNIQFQDESHQGQFDSNGNLIEGSPQTAGDASQAPNSLTSAASSQSGGHFWLWLLVIIILGGAGWWWLKSKKS